MKGLYKAGERWYYGGNKKWELMHEFDGTLVGDISRNPHIYTNLEVGQEYTIRSFRSANNTIWVTQDEYGTKMMYIATRALRVLVYELGEPIRFRYACKHKPTKYVPIEEVEAILLSDD